MDGVVDPAPGLLHTQSPPLVLQQAATCQGRVKLYMGQLTQPICSAPRLAICSLEGDWRSPGAAPHAGTRRHRRSIFRCTGCLWGAAMRYAGHGLQGNTAAVQQHCRRGHALAGQEQQACSTTRTVVRHFRCCSAALLAAVVSPASLLAGLRWCCQAGGDRGSAEQRVQPALRVHHGSIWRSEAPGGTETHSKWPGEAAHQGQPPPNAVRACPPPH